MNITLINVLVIERYASSRDSKSGGNCAILDECRTVCVCGKAIREASVDAKQM